MDIIKVENLKKEFEGSFAINNLSFRVKKESILAFLGTNGAGKTTTINILASLLNKTSGSIKINNKEITKDNFVTKNDIGIVFQEGVLDNHLTIYENIISRGLMLNLEKSLIQKRLNELAKELNFIQFLSHKYKTLSGGEKRKADIIRALINEPSILILDEPTTGLDPLSRSKFWLTLKRIKKKKNLTIIVTTHYMAEAEIADYILIIDKGKMLATGTPNDIIKRYSKSILLIYPKNIEKSSLLLANYSYKISNKTIEVEIECNAKALELINAFASSDNLIAFELRKGNLDDAFIKLTQ